MAKIPEPKVPHATDDTTGPNWPGTVDPRFNDPYRDSGGDTVGTRDYVGRRKAETPNPWR